MRRQIIIWLLIFSSSLAFAQVQITVPATSFKSEDEIPVKVINRSKTPVSYCIEAGHTSPKGGTNEATPIPFYFEKHDGSWHVLMIGPDVGSSRQPATLDVGGVHDFPFRLKGKGEMRLTLNYWVGGRDDVCSLNAKGKKTVRSQVFSIHE
jgi:hypothetical protein